MPRTWASSIPTRLVSRPVEAHEAHADFAFWGPTCDTIDHMKGPFSLPEKIREGDYIEIGNTGAYGRAMAGRFNGYGAFEEAILLDEPMLTMYPTWPERGRAARGAAGPGVSAKLDYLPAEQSFLDPVRADADDPASARAVVIPFGLEASVSYGGGTAAGPAAILAASQQLELYDEELGCEPYLGYGVAAVREPAIARPITAALAQLAGPRRGGAGAGKFPFVLGGEHSLTVGARPRARRSATRTWWCCSSMPTPTCATAIRASNSPTPPPCAACSTHPGVSLVSVGIRAISKGEVEFYEANRDRITIHWAKDQARWDIDEIVAPLARPAGVPDLRHRRAGCRRSCRPRARRRRAACPTGRRWPSCARACEAGNVVGADLVELAPIKGLHAYDYTAAAIAYKMLSYALA